jgi:hypothetical protein
MSDEARTDRALDVQSTPQGASTSVWAAVVGAADEVGGRYGEDCHVGAVVPDTVPTSSMTEGVREYAIDAKTAEALWTKSEELVEERDKRGPSTRRN